MVERTIIGDTIVGGIVSVRAVVECDVLVRAVSVRIMVGKFVVKREI